MITFELFYKDFTSFMNSPFDLDYMNWIKENASKHGSTVDFGTESIMIKAAKMPTICMTLVFIGYAYGMKENGR